MPNFSISDDLADSVNYACPVHVLIPVCICFIDKLVDLWLCPPLLNTNFIEFFHLAPCHVGPRGGRNLGAI